jgi:O-acetylhomoserine (thiol)-lyase
MKQRIHFSLGAFFMSQTAAILDMPHHPQQEKAVEISPLRHTTQAQAPEALAAEQLAHFGIDPQSAHGKALEALVSQLYHTNAAAHTLWLETMNCLNTLDRSDRQAYFNAKRFVCFQLAKILDNLQNPLRKSYQSLTTGERGFACKGPYPLFDNVAAIFSSTPVITRTATYLFACSEWVEDAFKGKEPLHEVYSRLLNPTSIALANHIVDLEAGPLAHEYLAWNFNSGMAAIDATLAHLIGYEDIVIASRNVYGGTFQLLQDWYGKRSNLHVAVEWFDGYDAQSFAACYKAVQEKYADRLAKGRRIYVYLESPCNPHGNVLDVAGISRFSHQHGSLVMCDCTVGTPFLQPLLRAENEADRPDFVIHSYTKDLAGSGATTAGVCIGRNERMFVPKGDHVSFVGPCGEESIEWEETLFWNVYYVKGAFLDADKAFEVMNGMRTYELRMLQKCINTTVLAKALDAHPAINVHCPVLAHSPNHALLNAHLFMGLPAPLFTIDMEGSDISRAAFKRFFDALEPAIGLQVSLGQTNTVALCPALTSHSEMPADKLREAGITPTTIRLSVGLEDPRQVLVHLMNAAALCLGEGIAAGFLSADAIDALYRETYLDVHRRHVEAAPSFAQLAA